MTDHFKLFNQVANEYKKFNKKEEINNQCEHKNIVKEKDTRSCEDCGMILSRNISYDKEWRYYGASDTKYHSDPNRCNIRKLSDRTILKDVENMGFSKKIINAANKIYQEVTNGKIYRGNSRKAIIFACIFHAYKIDGNPQSCEHLINIFNLERKIGLKGLKHVNLNADKNSQIRSTYITPENLISEIMDKFDASNLQKQEVIALYQKIKNKSSFLNRARPQSVASGLVRYYILIKRKNISIAEFKNKVQLSEMTINHVVSEIATILKNKELM